MRESFGLDFYGTHKGIIQGIIDKYLKGREITTDDKLWYYNAKMYIVGRLFEQVLDGRLKEKLRRQYLAAQKASTYYYHKV